MGADNLRVLPASRKSHVPLYRQIEETLRDFILSGKIKPHEALPSEDELAREFRVSRMTVRQAITELVYDGLVFRSHGQGTFVSDPKIARRLARLTSFSEDMRERGLQTHSTALSVDIVTPTQDVAEKLHIGAGDRVVRLERLRFAGEEPMALQVSHVPYSPHGEIILQNRDHESLYVLFESLAGCRIWKGEQTIEASPARKREASLLKVRRGFPLLVIERVTYDDKGTPLELARTLYRSDRFRYEITLFR